MTTYSDEDIAAVRLLCADTNTDPAKVLLSDDNYDSCLLIENGSIKRAAAAGLGIIAASEVLVSKVITTQDLQTDGAKVAAELRAQAKALRDQADVDDEADGFVFGVVEFQDGYTCPELAGIPGPCEVV